MRHVFDRRLFFALTTLLGLVALILFLATRPSAGLKAWKATMATRGERFTLTELMPPLSAGAIAWESNFNQAAQRLLRNTGAGGLWLMGTNAAGRSVAVWQRPDPCGPATPTNYWPRLTAMMKSNETVLATFRQLLPSRPAQTAYDARNPMPVSSPVNFVWRRLAAEGLTGAAIVALREGRAGDALSHLAALIDFAQAVDPGGTFLDYVVHGAIGEMGLRVTWELCQSSTVSEAQLAALQRRWQQFSFLSSAVQAMELERAHGLAWIHHTRTNPMGLPGLFVATVAPGQPVSDRISEAVISRLWRHSWSEGDEFLYLRIFQPVLEGLRSAVTNDSYAIFRARYQESVAIRDAETAGALAEFRRPFSSMTSSEAGRPYLAGWRYETFRRVVVCAVALQRFQLRHRQWPAQLNALVPEFLPAIPNDPMSGQPVRYRRLPDDQFLLWSVGENGVDDGGMGDDIDWPRVVPTG